METTNAVTLERMEGVIRWINGQDTQMQESEVRTAINDLIKSFRMKFLLYYYNFVKSQITTGK